MEPIRLLIVDDAAFMRDLLKDGLRATFPRFKIEEAGNGRTATERMAKTDFDMILCDWEMPEMTGPELLQWMRETPGKENIPFIMITSQGDKEHVTKAVEMKVDGFIVKPFTRDKLAGVVSKALCRSKGINGNQLRELATGPMTPEKAGSGQLGLSGAIPIANISEEPAKKKPVAKKPKAVQPKGKTVIALRFGDDMVASLVQSISLDKIEAVIKRADKMPGILDPTVADIRLGEEAARLNGYVQALTAREDSSKSQFVNITVRLVDQDDPDKINFLERYMASVG